MASIRVTVPFMDSWRLSDPLYGAMLQLAKSLVTVFEKLPVMLQKHHGEVRFIGHPPALVHSLQLLEIFEISGDGPSLMTSASVMVGSELSGSRALRSAATSTSGTASLRRSF